MDKSNQTQNPEESAGINFLVGYAKKGAILTTLNNLCDGSCTESVGPVDYKTYCKKNPRTYEIYISKQTEADRILQDIVKYSAKK